MSLRPAQPLITILGPTGTGKSTLATALASRLNGEVINADSLQLYAGLPIITNKIPIAEQRNVPHHLLGVVGHAEAPWVVGKFVEEAGRVMEEIRAKGKVPILVGGTGYYIQAFCVDGGRVGGNHVEDAILDGDGESEDAGAILKAETSVILERLREVDPIMAARWHPRDRRKIQRSLEIYLRTGRRPSEIYAEQGGEEESAPRMRFPTLLFWTHTQTEALKERLDNRVDKMLEDGLMKELVSMTALKDEQEREGSEVDVSRGIWVAIGFKEFAKYIAALKEGKAEEQELERLKCDALERMKAATRQYAKRQTRWMRRKLLSDLQSTENTSVTGRAYYMYALDATDMQRWEENVEQPALAIAQQFLAGEEMPEVSSVCADGEAMLTPEKADLASRREDWGRWECEHCGVIVVIKEEWERHLRSQRHRRVMKKQANALHRRRPVVEGITTQTAG